MVLVTITSESLLWSSSSFLAAGTSEVERAREPKLDWRETVLRVGGFLTLPTLASSASHGFALVCVVEVVVVGLTSEGAGAAAAATKDPREKRLAQRSGAGRDCESSPSDELSGLTDRRFAGRDSGAFVTAALVEIGSDEEAEAALLALVVWFCRRGLGTVLLARTGLSGCRGSKSDESEFDGDPDLRSSSSAETKLEEEVVVDVALTSAGAPPVSAGDSEERFVPSRGEIPLSPMLAHSIGGGDAARFRLTLSAKNRDSTRSVPPPSDAEPDPDPDSDAEESTMTVSLTRGFVVVRVEVG